MTSNCTPKIKFKKPPKKPTTLLFNLLKTLQLLYSLNDHFQV